MKEINIPLGTREKFEKMLPGYKGLFVQVVKSIVPEHVNTEVTKEDLADAWVDEYGVKYSKDRTRLLKGNSMLSSYTILAGTKVICDNAFGWCLSLKEINIPNSVTSIGKLAFDGCFSLEEINIPDSVTSIGDNPFGGCRNLRNINCLSKCFIVHDDALYTADMKKIISYIGKASSFTIPNTVTCIGNLAFYNCKLSLLNIPESVTNIGYMAFLKDFYVVYSYWKHIECHSKNFKFCNGALYTADMSKIISYFGMGESFTIPSSVNCIGDRAFYKCAELKTVIIPSSVTKIGEEAFFHCHAKIKIECLSEYFVINDRELCTLDMKKKFTNIKECRMLASMAISFSQNFNSNSLTALYSSEQEWKGFRQGGSFGKILSYLKKHSL